MPRDHVQSSAEQCRREDLGSGLGLMSVEGWWQAREGSPMFPHSRWPSSPCGRASAAVEQAGPHPGVHLSMDL